MKLALLSAVYGTYEATAKPLPADLGIPAVMFTDNPGIAEQAPSAGWSVVVTSYPYERFDASDGANGDPAIVTPMLAHKYWKTHPAEAMERAANLVGHDIDASIWIDGNMRITMPGAEWVARNVEALGDDEWSLMRHPWRGCVFEEHAYTRAVCSGRYSVEAMDRQIAAEPVSNHPRGWGLFATGHMVRRHTAAVVDVGELWWLDNVQWSHQDQLSLPPLIRMYSEGSTFVAPVEPLRWNANLPWGLWELQPHGA